MGRLIGAVSCLALAIWGRAAFAQAGDSYKVQTPELAAPTRGSLAGSLSKTAFGPGDLERGTFSLPAPFAAPQERGPLLAQVFPTYSAEAGISEWGMGWATDLALTRWRASGDDVYSSEDLTGPFGRCKKGSDGNWYPVGLAQLVRIEPSGSGFVAYTADGTKWTFGQTRRVTTSRGVYAWYLEQVETVTGRRTNLTYQTNTSGRPFLTQVDYGGLGSSFQHRVTIAYTTLARTFTDYRSGVALILDRRVSAVSALSVNAQTGGWQVRWSFTPTYRADSVSPAFYLEQVEQTFASGEKAPPVRYGYELSADTLATAAVKRNTKFDGVVRDYSATVVYPTFSAVLDAGADGLEDLEVASNNTLIRQTADGFIYEPLPPTSATARRECRAPASASNLPRTLAAMRSGSDDAQVVALTPSGSNTKLTLCDRAGEPLFDTTIAKSWTLGPKARLVDVNGDHAPDLIQVAYNAYLVVPNRSNGDGFSFGAPIAGTLNLAYTFNGIWIQDFNGDGLPDIITRSGMYVAVYHNLGNFKFDPTPRAYQILNSQGQPFDATQYTFTWVDADHDGLIDLYLSSNQIAYLFRNTGTSFVPVTVGGQSWITATSYPIFVDLAGSGNAEVYFIQNGAGSSLALSNPGTGLMSSADDGKGTVLHFSYKRAPPAAGARRRQAVLESLTVQSTGYADVTYEYDYSAPVVHSEGKFLVGYGEVDRWHGDVSGVPLGTTWTTFLNGDTFAGLHDESGTQDAFAPGIERFSKTTYEPQDPVFRGLPWKRVYSQESGWRTVDLAQPQQAVVSETTYYRGYFPDFCPSSIEKVTSSGTVLEGRQYVSLAAFSHSLACIAGDVTQSSEGPYGFSYETAISHNDVGQVTQVASVAGADVWVLQNTSYDSQWRVQSVSSPGKGATSVTYDPVTGLLASVTSPSGVVVTAVDRDRLTDGLRQLRTDRGGLVYDQWYRYDGQERLALGWDSIGAGGQLNPDFTFSYRYATASVPASITATTLVDAGTMSVRTTMDLLTAKGEDVGAVTQIPEGWAVGRIAFRDPSAGQASTYTQSTFGPGVDPGQLPLSALFAGADWVVDRRAGEFDVGTTTTRLHADVQRQVAEALGVDQGLLVKSATENGSFTQTHASDASSHVLGFWNEAGTAWTYVYDPLGRLREVRLPDGTGHRVSYDAHGRVSQVQRDAIATIDYAYDPVTGLLTQKRFTGNTGVLRRKELTGYDAIGRVSVETHQDVSSGASLAFSYFYDGATASNPSDRSQLGLLSGVTGQGFEKVFSYRPDGKLASRTLTLAAGWRKLVTTFDYDEAGGEKQESTLVKDLAGAVVASSSTTQAYDTFGRAATTSLAGSILASYTYDANGLLESAALAGGNSLTLTYDQLTRALVGTRQLSAGTLSFVERRFNDRALVDRDDLTVGALSLRRSYTYSDQRFLTMSADARATSSYAYSPSGLPVSISQDGHVPQVVTQKDDLGRTIVRNDLVMSYGPDGQLASARRGSAIWTFVYDEAGQRLLKFTNGTLVAAYPEEGFLDASGLTQSVKISGRSVGLLVNGAFEPRSTDLLGSPIADLDGTPRIASPYGSRWLDGHPARSAALDYVEKGFDADLGFVRMGVRDYDPDQAAFITPDPKYLENTTRGDASVNESLYAYSLNVPLLFIDPSGLDPLPFNASAGHHFTPQAVTEVLRAEGRISPEAAAELISGEGATTGWSPKSAGVPEHQWSAAHAEYNAAVKAEFEALYPKGTRMATPAQARAFNEFLRTGSKNPAVRGFLDPHVRATQAMRASNATADEVNAQWEPTRTGFTRAGGFKSFFSSTLSSVFFFGNSFHVYLMWEDYETYARTGEFPEGADPMWRVQVLSQDTPGGLFCVRHCNDPI